MHPSLPVELTDRVIDCLWDDTPSLCRCAITCRSWFPRSHFNLYRHVRLGSRTSFESLVSASRLPHIAASLASAHLLELRDTSPGWVHRLPFVLGKTFAGVQQLHIEHLRWEAVALHPDTIPFGFAQFRCITELVISGCTFRNARQFQCLVCTLVQLRTLRVHTTTTSNRATVSLTRCSRVPPLSDISTDPNVDQPLVWTLLELLLPTATLRKLHLYPSLPLVPQVGKVLESLGSNLEVLSLFLDQSFSNSGLEHLNIHKCTALRTFGLRGSRSIYIEDMLRVIAPQSRIQNLWLRVNTLDSSPNIRSILDEARFSELRQFTISTFPQEANDSITDAIGSVCERGVRANVSFEFPYVYPSPGAEG